LTLKSYENLWTKSDFSPKINLRTKTLNYSNDKTGELET